MTERELQEIEARAADKAKHWNGNLYKSVEQDIPALVAEVRQLKRHVVRCGAMIRGLKADPSILRGKYAKRFIERMELAKKFASYPCAKPNLANIKKRLEELRSMYAAPGDQQEK